MFLFMDVLVRLFLMGGAAANGEPARGDQPCETTVVKSVAVGSGASSHGITPDA